MEMVMHSTGDESESSNGAWKPHFFKIIVSPIIQLQELRIPAAFVKKFGKSLLDYASLRAPEGAVWKVGLTKRKGDVHLDEGWQDFAEYHSLAFGHLLVFKYEGNSQFEVTLFDKKGTEIEYPNRSTKVTETGGASNENRQRLDHHNESNIRGVQNGAVERAKAFESSNPHFSVVVKPSYLSNRFIVSVPVPFAREHMKKESNYTMRLQTAAREGKTWAMKCYFMANKRVAIGAGWKKFVRDNRLRVGDVCLFELTHRGNKAYRVHIFRK